ncbi:hypothetical protein L1987_58247 [Smallanthus sonchifolius]|uniref:Uncharacterized protein n=1 Tax=Smallanthus sonchifolius TaxID=185202 RepID=A0ACB9DFL3_9ASTR|nr:hypothetical protein L1987_58247 [Smallanthus sonchifolius]
MLCFETRIDSQRYRQRVSEFKTSSSTFIGTTDLAIESYVFYLYSHEIFFVVRKEIMKGKLFYYISNTEIVDDIFVFSVTHLEHLVGQPLDVDIEINNPDVARNKGCRKHRRLIGPGEKQSTKPPKAPRLCRTCMEYIIDHDSRNCKKKFQESTNDTEASSSTQLRSNIFIG